MNARRLSRLILTGVVAAFIAVPTAVAARGNLVQIDGRLVAPAQISEAQLQAGQAPSTRLVQIAGSLVEPSQMSVYQSHADRSTGNTAATGGSSTDFGAGAIAATAAGGLLLLVASSSLLLRRRRGLAPA